MAIDFYNQKERQVKVFYNFSKQGWPKWKCQKREEVDIEAPKKVQRPK